MTVDRERIASIVFDILWPMQEWDGSEECCRAASDVVVGKVLAALPPPPAGDGERAALIELIAAIDKARDLIPDDDEGLASELFAKYINGASVRAQLVLYPPAMLSAAPPGQEG